MKTRTGIAIATALLLLASLAAACASRPAAPTQVIHEQAAAMRAAITKVVDDLPRRAELLQQVDQMESILLEQNGDLSRLSQELQVLNGDYDATQAAFESVLGQFAERSRVRFDRVQAAHFAMVERMDAKEWKQVIHLERAALEAMGTPTAPEMPGGKP